MKLHFCTLFNSAYLARGLAMYRSLKEVCPDFHLYVFAFDDATHAYFQKEKLADLTVISLQEFENPELLRVKPDRTAGEYCWTSTSSTILYCIQTFQLDHCTYIDADMIFYHNPGVLLQEMGDHSVMITEHRYTALYDQSATSGIYCVQFVTFKNDARGMKVLKWWRDACIEWCYNRHEDGKFGDQKYLDDWTTRFEGVHVMRHEGGGVAPWNVQQYDILQDKEGYLVKNKKSGKVQELVFFHFHGLKFYSGDMVELTGSGYSISEDARRYLYLPYAKQLFSIGDHVSSQSSISNPNGVSQTRIPGRNENGKIIWKKNIYNRLRHLAGRIPAYRKEENQVYHRSEL
ncbi:MAG: hypothetical protein K1X54_00550 [Flavobacteriales bacterium]|nr:hypothetical protein [Flavobacteriales bacterium]